MIQDEDDAEEGKNWVESLKGSALVLLSKPPFFSFWALMSCIFPSELFPMGFVFVFETPLK